MSRKDAVVLASRVLGLFFILAAAIGMAMLLLVPATTYAVTNLSNGPGSISAPFHPLKLDMVYSLLLHAVQLIVGFVFWKGGPRIERVVANGTFWRLSLCDFNRTCVIEHALCLCAADLLFMKSEVPGSSLPSCA